jgi:hypothetical protein
MMRAMNVIVGSDVMQRMMRMEVEALKPVNILSAIPGHRYVDYRL